MSDDARDTDEELLARLGQALDAEDPPPADLVQAIKNSLDWASADVRLAELVSDSRLTGAALVRGAAPDRIPRVLTFTSDTATLVVEVVDEPSGTGPVTRRVVGQLMPPATAEVTVRTSDGPVSTVVFDEHGRFRTTGLPTAPLALTIRYDDESDHPAFATGWIS